jgi:predicted N-acetyltransferase YhbS
MQISTLRDRPAFADVIADRAWHAWWTESGKPLSDDRAHLDPMIQHHGLPFALVAHEGDAYLGSVLVIESDLEARPHLTPWIAALWVEPDRRRQGIGARLVEAARAAAAALGQATCHLAAVPDRGPYYLRLGFRRIETGVDGLDLFAIASRGATAPTPPPGRL